jgi:hypothetical protein
MLRQNRTVPRTRRLPIVDSDGEDEPTYIPGNSSSPLKGPNLRSHTIRTDIKKPVTSTNTRIRQWRKLISREAYVFKPDAIPATYPEEWLHEKLPRLHSPLPSTDFVPLSWMTTSASARAKMNITAADNMEMVAQGLRNSSRERLFCEAFGDLQEHWREELRQSVLRKKALHGQGLLQPNSSQ